MEEDSILDIAQPEILTKNDLITEIVKRNVKIDDLETLTKEALVDIFYKTVVPMPQRKYRLNRRGKKMTENQLMNERKKRKFDQISVSNSDGYVTVGESSKPTTNSRFMSPYNPPSLGSRIKPPPTSINYDRKVIKLGKPISDVTPHINNAKQTGEATVSPSTNSNTKQCGLIRLNTPDVTKIVKTETSSAGNIEIKTFTKKVPKTPNAADDSTVDATVKITKIVPPKRISTTKIKLKRPINIESQSKQNIVSSEETNGSSSANIMDTTIPNSPPTTPVSVNSVHVAPQPTEKLENVEEEAGVIKKFKRIDVNFP